MTKTLNDVLAEEFTVQAARMEEGGIKSKTISIHLITDYSGNRSIKYYIGDYSDSDKVEGRDLHDIVTEYMRRKGWTEANKPMTMLAAPPTFSLNHTTLPNDKSDDIPF